MIDIQQHRVKPPARLLRVETVRGLRAREEVGVHHSAARIAREFFAQRNQAALMPFDHRLQGVHHQQRCDLAMLERRHRRVSESEPAHHDIPARAFQLSQSQMGERDLHLMEQARHQERVPELYLVNLDAA